MPAERSLLEIDDDRVKLVSITAADGADAEHGWLVKLQSFAEETVQCRVRTLFEVSSAATASYLGDQREQLSVESDGVTVTIPPLGTVAVAYQLG